MGAISADRVNGRYQRNPSTQKEANPPNILNTLPQNHPLIRLNKAPSPCWPPGPPSSPESFRVGVPFKPFAPLFSPFAVGLSPFNTPLTASTGVPPGVSNESGSGRPLDMIPPPPGEAADGEDALPFPFPFGPGERGLAWVQVLGWKKGTRKIIQPITRRDSTQKARNGWRKREKRNG